jgi:hypothetical protein
MEEYKMYPIFDDLDNSIYCNDMKLVLFCGETIKGYIMEREYITKRVLYKNRKVDMVIENCRTIGDLKKRLCKGYCLDRDIIITDAEKELLTIIRCWRSSLKKF